MEKDKLRLILSGVALCHIKKLSHLKNISEEEVVIKALSTYINLNSTNVKDIYVVDNEGNTFKLKI